MAGRNRERQDGAAGANVSRRGTATRTPTASGRTARDTDVKWDGYGKETGVGRRRPGSTAAVGLRRDRVRQRSVV